MNFEHFGNWEGRLQVNLRKRVFLHVLGCGNTAAAKGIKPTQILEVEFGIIIVVSCIAAMCMCDIICRRYRTIKFKLGVPLESRYTQIHLQELLIERLQVRSY